MHGKNWKRFGKVDFVVGAASRFLQEVGLCEKILYYVYPVDIFQVEIYRSLLDL